MTGFGEMIFQNGMEQGEKSIVEYMMKTGKYSLEEISPHPGAPCGEHQPGQKDDG